MPYLSQLKLENISIKQSTNLTEVDICEAKQVAGGISGYYSFSLRETKTHIDENFQNGNKVLKISNSLINTNQQAGGELDDASISQQVKLNTYQ